MKKNYLIFHSRGATLKSKNNPYNLDQDATRILSNFGMIPIMWRGNLYPTVEHAFQGAKYLLATDRPDKETLFRTGSVIIDPRDAKKHGGKQGMKKHHANLDVEKWNSMSEEIMRQLIIEKAKDIRIQKILMTCRLHNIRLYHFSRFDMKWGCNIDKQGNITRGKNRLGYLYMDIGK